MQMLQSDWLSYHGLSALIVHHEIFSDSNWFKLITWRDNVHPRRDTISAQCRPSKIIVVSGFLIVFFFKFYTWLSRISSWKVGNNSIWFFNLRAEENLVVNNKDNRVFLLRNYLLIVAPLKFDVLKTSLSFKIPRSSCHPIVPRQKHAIL